MVHISPTKMGCFSSSNVVVWLFLLRMAATAVQAHARSPQDDFISIDCGMAGNFSYVDKVTNITYVSDKGYIDTGSSYNIASYYKTSTLPSQLLSVRSFPVGDRNCYTLPVLQSRRYLVRARFMYGNYDGKNKASAVNPLQFHIHLGINHWRVLNITNASLIYTQEALTVTATNFMSICLMNIGNGDPFISALELRPLKDTMYNLSQSDLALLGRLNMGALTDEVLRYPEDPYDRFWEPFNSDAWTTLSTNLSVDNADEHFEVPSAVLQTAETLTNGRTMSFYLESGSKDDELYHILSFTELEALDENSTRLFDIYKNDEMIMEKFIPQYLMSNYDYNTMPFSNYTLYNYSLQASDDSTLPPLINAFEVYSVIPATEVPTDLDDVYAINGIKEQYDIVKRNWMVDPCSPRQYIWDGLNCTYGSNSARITELNLSSSGLSGPISSSFANLSELTYLDLSNNSLTGAIPDNLGNMQSLRVLVLPCNYSTGPIPVSLRQRSEEGKVTLTYNNGAGACQKSPVSSPLSSSTTSKISKPIIAGLSMGLILLLIGI